MKTELELYLHIPFCLRKCAYCDFFSSGGTGQEIEGYVQALLREIDSCREMAGSYTVTTVFLGGGTPSLLSGMQTERIFDVLNHTFDITNDAEITMEMNPGTVTEEKLLAYRRAGVNRLSIGLQSVHDDELRMLGRIHTWEDFLHTWSLTEKAGFLNRNIDLISALPGQSVESWEDTLRTVIALEPEHISAYSLILEEGTPMYERRENFPELPNEDEEFTMGERTIDLLERAGYHRYEISNYAKEGFACRHNLGYWERKNYLGIGAGASSLIDNVRFEHVRDREQYIRQTEMYRQSIKKREQNVEADGQQPETGTGLALNKRKLSVREQMEEFMFLGLRKTAGVSRQKFAECFGVEIENVYGSAIKKLTGQKLLAEENGMLRLTRRGLDISNYAMAEFLFPEDDELF